MTTRTEALNDLFAGWKTSYGNEAGNFAEDGIIFEEKWNAARRKVLFLLKETNDFAGDFRAEVRRKPWLEIGFLAYGLQTLGADGTPTFRMARNESNWKDACLSSAIVNLKKLKGPASSKPEVIHEAAQRDRERIWEELAIVQPDIVVCGGTFDIFREVFSDLCRFQPVSPDEQCFLHKTTLWLDFSHPGAIVPHYMMYYAVTHLFRNYLLTRTT
jgi:hypothetical protein